MNGELKFLNNRDKKKFKKIATSRKKSKGSIEDVVCQILPELEEKFESLAKVEEASQKDDEETEVKKDFVG